MGQEFGFAAVIEGVNRCRARSLAVAGNWNGETSILLDHETKATLPLRLRGLIQPTGLVIGRQ